MFKEMDAVRHTHKAHIYIHNIYLQMFDPLAETRRVFAAMDAVRHTYKAHI